MKKIFFVFAIVAMAFTSCNPLEDVYSEVDAQENVIVGDANITLTDDNYTDAVEDGGFGLSFPNFGSVNEAKTMVPAFLTNLYPVWGKSSSANVTFKYYNKVNTYSRNVEKVSTADYEAIEGAGATSFNSSSDIYKYLDLKYPAAADGDFYSVSHKLTRSGVTNTIVDGFVRDANAGRWNRIVGFTTDQYNAMGESYPNFSNHDEAAEKIPAALSDRFKFDNKSAGDIEAVMYELYKGGGVTKSYVNNYIFDGSTWSKYNNVLSETIKFGHDGSVWVPDNTIKYTLTGADYALVGNDRYNNFDVRPGKDEEAESARLAKINTILLNNFPSDAEGQKYIVSYNIYNGSNGVWQMAVIKTGGVYVLQ